MRPDMDSKRRVLEGLAGKAKEWKADAMRRKYMPPEEEAPLDEPPPPPPEPGEEGMELMEEAPEAVLAKIDPEQLKQLLAALASK